jgi:hypothetical protein
MEEECRQLGIIICHRTEAKLGIDFLLTFHGLGFDYLVIPYSPFHTKARTRKNALRGSESVGYW